MNKFIKFNSNLILLSLICCVTQTYGLEPNFSRPERLLTASGGSWSYPQPQGFFFCYGFNDANQKLLNGVEFSFRPNDQKSQLGACRNLLQFSHQPITGKDLKEPGITNINNFQFHLTNSDDYPFESVMYQSNSGSLYGWYRINSKSAFERQKRGMFAKYKHDLFSEGVFGPPLDEIPQKGVAKYRGIVSDPSRIGGFPFSVGAIPVALIDFDKGEITIYASFSSVPNLIRISSIEPIKFNRTNGNFGGKIRITSSDTYEGYVNGFIGGKNGEGIFAQFSIGDAFVGEGADFILGIKE